MTTISRITPCLWFDSQAEEAAHFYTGIFRNSRITQMAYYTDVGKEHHGKAAGSVMTVGFELDGQAFTALNGGPLFRFNEAISLQVMCDSQEEVDYYWEKLSAGGDPRAQVCGWLKDRFGVSWQVVPKALPDMTADADTARVERVMAEIFKMRKIDIATLERAYAG